MRLPALLPVLAFAAAAAGSPGAVRAADFSVELKRGLDAPAPVRDWFRAVDRLLGKADEVTDLLARDAARPTPTTAARAVVLVDVMSWDYEKIAKDAAGVKAVRRTLDEVRRRSPGTGLQKLPAETAEAVFSLDGESLNRWAQLMRQSALTAFGPSGSVPANSLLTVTRGEGKPVEVAFLDVSDATLAEAGRILAPSLRGLTALLPDLKPAGASVILARERLWLRRSGAEFFADFGTRRSDGALRVRYRETRGSALDQAAFYLFTKALYDTGLAVSVEDGELVAVPSGERASLDPETRAERLAMAWKAFDLMRRLVSDAGRPYLAGYLEGSVSQEENSRRLDALARIFAAEGSVPFFDEGRPEGLRKGVDEHRRGEPAREALRVELSASLSRLGLPSFPAGAPVGQRTIGLYYNGPIEAALARGEVQRSPKGFVRDRSYDPLASLGKDRPRGRGIPSADLSPIVDHAATIGLVGPDLAQRASWRVGPDEWLSVAVLLDGGSGRVSALEAHLCPLSGRPKPVGPDRALTLLRGIGVMPAEGPPPSEPAGPEGPRSASGAVLEEGLGRRAPFTARVTYDRGRASMGESIFVTPYLAHGDRAAARRSRAIITTSAGPQTVIHAGRSGVPLLNLSQAEWSEGSGIVFDEPVYGPPRRLRSGRSARDVVRRVRRSLREGEAVRFDPVGMTIEFLPPGRQEILVRLEEALRAYDRGADIQGMALWTVSQLTASDLTREQKRELSAMLLQEMEKRRKAGFPPSHLERIQAVLKENSPG